MASAEPSTAVPRRLEKAPGAFRTISEVAQELAVQQHVLRFWETKFTQIRPVKRGGGRRYYRPEDVTLLRTIRGLLYDDGYTIRGVQKVLRKGGHRTSPLAAARLDRKREKAGGSAPPTAVDAGSVVVVQRKVLEDLVGELAEIRDLLRRSAG